MDPGDVLPKLDPPVAVLVRCRYTFFQKLVLLLPMLRRRTLHDDMAVKINPRAAADPARHHTHP
jgi:hypothetical protein